MANLLDLTPREIEILKFVLSGQTNKAIASQICTTEKTIEFHLNHIYTEIGMWKRLMAGRWAVQQWLGVKAREIPSQFSKLITKLY